MIIPIEDAIKLIDEIEKCGCDCDAMNGYTCKIHDLTRKLKEGIQKPVSYQDTEDSYKNEHCPKCGTEWPWVACDRAGVQWMSDGIAKCSKCGTTPFDSVPATLIPQTEIWLHDGYAGSCGCSRCKAGRIKHNLTPEEQGRIDMLAKERLNCEINPRRLEDMKEQRKYIEEKLKLLLSKYVDCKITQPVLDSISATVKKVLSDLNNMYSMDDINEHIYFVVKQDYFNPSRILVQFKAKDYIGKAFLNPEGEDVTEWEIGREDKEKS